jgi:hypothetical protein
VGFSDTGRPGPTWTRNGQRCLSYDPGGTENRCVVHPDNQYLVWLYGTGTMRACASSGICGEVTVQ